MLKSPPLVATLSDSKRMSPCSWGDIFTWPLRGDRIIGLRHFTAKHLTISVRRAILSRVCLRRASIEDSGSIGNRQVPPPTTPPEDVRLFGCSFRPFHASRLFTNICALIFPTVTIHLLLLQSL